MIVANWKANGDIKKNYLWCETFQNLLDKSSFNYVGISPSHIHFHQLNTFFKELMKSVFSLVKIESNSDK